jgi:hypothetical protein
VPITQREIGKTRARLAAQDPRLAAQFDEAARAEVVSAARFRAADLSVAGYPPIIAVATLDYDFPEPSEFFVLESQFRQLGFEIVDTSRPRLGRDQGFRIDLGRDLKMPDGSLLPIRMTQFLVPGGDGITLVAVAAQDTPDGALLIDDLLGRVRRA